ncbi:MAG: hypothetical protein NTY35_12830 [Planctomycetota bacterium]|nr:hypothetical protein [Planctomycetota bacterium]
MKLVSFLAFPAVVLLVAACSSPDRNRPELARSEVVVLMHQPADQLAGRVCGILHGGVVGSPADRAGGCTSREHAAGHHADGTAHISLIADPRTNSLVVTAPPGHDEEFARAIALVHQLDQPATAAN